MKRPIPPCLGCPDRDEYCHADCERYETFVRRAEAFRELVYKEKLPDAYRDERIYEMFKRRRR